MGTSPSKASSDDQRRLRGSATTAHSMENLSPSKAAAALRKRAQDLLSVASSATAVSPSKMIRSSSLWPDSGAGGPGKASPVKSGGGGGGGDGGGGGKDGSDNYESRSRGQSSSSAKRGTKYDGESLLKNTTWSGPRGFGVSSPEKLKEVKKQLAKERRARKLARKKREREAAKAEERVKREAKEERQAAKQRAIDAKRAARKRGARRVGKGGGLAPAIAPTAGGDRRRRVNVNETLRDYSKVSESIWDILGLWPGGPQFQVPRGAAEVEAIPEHPKCPYCTSKHRHAALMFVYRRCHICKTNFVLPEEHLWDPMSLSGGAAGGGGWRDELGVTLADRAPRRLVVQCASFGHKHDAARAWDVTAAMQRLIADNAGEFLEVLDTLPMEELLKGSAVDWDHLAELAMQARAQEGGMKDDGRDNITLKIRYCMRTKGVLVTQPHRHFGVIEVDCKFAPAAEEEMEDSESESEEDEDLRTTAKKKRSKKLGRKDKADPPWWERPGAGRYRDSDIRGSNDFGTNQKMNVGTHNARVIGNFFWLTRPILLELLDAPPLTMIDFALWGAVGPMRKEERGCVEITEWLQGRIDEVGGEYLFIPRQENMRKTFGEPASYRHHQLYIEYLVEGKSVRRYSQVMREGRLVKTCEVGHVPLVAPLLVIEKAEYGVTVGDLQYKVRQLGARIRNMEKRKKIREERKLSAGRGERELMARTKKELKQLARAPLGFRDVRDTVQTFVNRNGGHALEMLAGKDTDLEALFGDPLPGINKQLKLSYHVNCDADSCPNDYLPSGRKVTYWMRRQGRLRTDAIHDEAKYFDTEVNDFLYVNPEARLKHPINLRVDPCLPPLTIVKAYWERFKHGERLKPTRLDGPTWFEYATCQQDVTPQFREIVQRQGGSQLIITPEESVFQMAGLPGSDPYANRLVVEYETLGLRNALIVPESKDERTKGPGGKLFSDVWVGYQMRQPENHDTPDPVAGPGMLPDIKKPDKPKRKKLTDKELDEMNIVEARHAFEALSGGGISKAQQMMYADKQRKEEEQLDGNMEEYVDPTEFNYVVKRNERDVADDKLTKAPADHQINREEMRRNKLNVSNNAPNFKARAKMKAAWKAALGWNWNNSEKLEPGEGDIDDET